MTQEPSSVRSYEVRWSIVVDAPDVSEAASLGLGWLREQVAENSVAVAVYDRETGERTFVREETLS